MGAILEAGGSSFADVVKCTILLTDMKHFATVNEVYAKSIFLPSRPYPVSLASSPVWLDARLSGFPPLGFHTNPPARATFAVSGLPKGALVEIECIAALTKRAKKPKSSPGTVPSFIPTPIGY
jgi:2-iminobutanoate/2-iminopropanoate deaminase